MLEPVNDYLIVTLLKDEGESTSGIIRPESSEPMFTKGLVISRGPGKTLESGARLLTDSVDKGDKILFALYAATKIKEDGETVYFVKEADILAKIK
jgi:co-chaperonin GroES (HSP10)